MGDLEAVALEVVRPTETLRHTSEMLGWGGGGGPNHGHKVRVPVR